MTDDTQHIQQALQDMQQDFNRKMDALREMIMALGTMVDHLIKLEEASEHANG